VKPLDGDHEASTPLNVLVTSDVTDELKEVIKSNNLSAVKVLVACVSAPHADLGVWVLDHVLNEWHAKRRGGGKLEFPTDADEESERRPSMHVVTLETLHPPIDFVELKKGLEEVEDRGSYDTLLEAPSGLAFFAKLIGVYNTARASLGLGDAALDGEEEEDDELEDEQRDFLEVESFLLQPLVAKMMNPATKQSVRHELESWLDPDAAQSIGLNWDSLNNEVSKFLDQLLDNWDNGDDGLDRTEGSRWAQVGVRDYHP